jgi:hypothetical protein
VQFLSVSVCSSSPLARQGDDDAQHAEQPGELPRGGFKPISNLQGTMARALVLNTLFMEAEALVNLFLLLTLSSGTLSRIQICFFLEPSFDIFARINIYRDLDLSSMIYFVRIHHPNAFLSTNFW